MTFTTSILEANYQSAAGFFDAAAESLVAAKADLAASFAEVCGGCSVEVDTIKVSLFQRWNPEDTDYVEPPTPDAPPYVGGNDCPNGCSGHGACSTNGCVCHAQWGNGDETGGACDQRQCPFEVAWVDTPSAENKGHTLRECAGRGVCDRHTGDCMCFSGYGGVGCRRATCPSNELAKLFSTRVRASAGNATRGLKALQSKLMELKAAGEDEEEGDQDDEDDSEKERDTRPTPLSQRTSAGGVALDSGVRSAAAAAAKNKKNKKATKEDGSGTKGIKALKAKVLKQRKAIQEEEEEREYFEESSAKTAELPCSGHGTCEYLSELRNDVGDGFKFTGSKPTRDQYRHDVTFVWDAHKSMACVCDPGYSGPDCSVRMCPRGDYSNYYKTAKRPETQALVFSNVFTPGTDEMNGDFKTSDGMSGSDTNGEFALTFRSTLNEEFTTTTLNVYNLTEASLEKAINSLPNGVVSDATVTLYRNLSKYNATSYEQQKSAAKVGNLANGYPYDPATNYSWYDTDLVVLITFNGHMNRGDQFALECRTAYCGAGCQPLVTHPLDFKKGSSCAVVNDCVEPVGVNWECSGRGACRWDGTCDCYEGYADDACSSKAAII